MSPARLLVLLLLAPPAALGAGVHGGGPLMREPFGPRAAALGQAYVSLADDAFGSSYNPAGLARLSETRLGFQHTNTGPQRALSHLGLATPLTPRHALGLNVSQYDAGRTELFDAAGTRTSERSVQTDRLITAAYAFALRDALPVPGSLYLGAGGRYFTSTLLEESSARVLAFDLGALYQFPLTASSLLNVGVSRSNIGGGVTYTGGSASGSASDPLPATTRLGASWQLAMRPANMATASFEVDHVAEEGAVAALGLEYLFHGLVAARAGFRFGDERGNLSFGAGLNVKRFRFDYAVQPNEAGSVHQVSIEYAFSLPALSYPAPSVPRPPEPESPFEMMYARADKDVDARRFFAARESLGKILLWIPDSPRAKATLERLEKSVDAVLAGRKSDPERHYAAFYRRYYAQEWKEAMDAYALARAANSDKPDGEKAYKDAAEKLAELRRIARLERREQANELFALAMSAADARQYDRALKLIEQVLAIGDHPPSRYLKAKIEEERRRAAAVAPAPKAAARPVTAEDIAKSNELYYEAMRQYAGGSLDKAVKTLKRATELNPDNRELTSTYSRLVREQGGD